MITFDVTGSKGDLYEIKAIRMGEHFRMTCTCEAGQQGTYCKHRFSLLDGEVSNLSSGNVNDIIILRELFSGTEAEKEYQAVRELEQKIALLQAEVRRRKKALARIMCS